jgi:hypothetical protein
MGAEPLKDMLMSMRFRSKLDEKIHAQTEQKANELENTITSVADSSEDGVAELGNILRDASYGMLSEKQLLLSYMTKWILKRPIALDPNHEASIFAKGRTESY